MSRKSWLAALLVALVANVGCCRWCDRHCGSGGGAPVNYAPAPVCCTPAAPVCAPVAAPAACPPGCAPAPTYQRPY